MATIGNGVLTLLDVAKRLGPDSKVARIVEMLSITNPILDDMMWKEGNLPTGERTVIRTGLPAVYWRLLNQGVPTSKSTTAQVDEQCSMLEAWSEVDVALAKLAGDEAAFRLSEAQAFLEAMNQKMATTLFYGNSSTAPEEFNGLSVRYSTKSGATNGQNVVDCGGSGSDNTSIWLVGWGEQSAFGVYPKGLPAGLEHEDIGLQTAETVSGVGGSRMRVLQDRFTWNSGLVVKDWRYVVRACNIDVSDLVANAGAQALIPTIMIKMLHRLPNLAAVRPIFYMNRTVFEYLDIQRLTNVTNGGGLTYENVDGKAIYGFRGIPIKQTDALLETEARVV